MRNLTPRTNYFFNITTCDGFNTTYNCRNVTYNISTADYDAPDIVNVTNTTTNNSINITFDTNELANATVGWNHTVGVTNISNWSFANNASITLWMRNLTPRTNYFFNITTYDGFNTTYNCRNVTYNISTADYDAPVAHNVTNTTTNNSINITFDTNELANATVGWNHTVGVTNISNWSFANNASITLWMRNLTPRTNYFFNITTCDGF